MLKKVQMRGGARRPHARRSLVRGVRGHVWAPQTKVRRSDNLARYVARRPRAPYLRRWAFIGSLRGYGRMRWVYGPGSRSGAARVTKPQRGGARLPGGAVP